MRPAKIALEERRKKENLQKIEDEYFGKVIPAARAHDEKQKFVFCPDIGYSHLQKLRFGRFSFNGANTEVEKLMKLDERQRKGESDETYQSDDEKEIGDEEMANSGFGRRFQKPTPAALQIFTEEHTSDKQEESGTAAVVNQAMRDKKRFEPYRRGRGGFRQKFKKK